MKEIRIFSVYRISQDIKRWKKRFQYLNIITDVPSDDCYVIFKQLSSNIGYPIEALIGAQRGFVEGWINKRIHLSQIYQPSTFEVQLEIWNEDKKIKVGGLANETTLNIVEPTLIL
jgi:hypothetical protein